MSEIFPGEWPFLYLTDTEGNDNCSALESLEEASRTALEKMAVELLWNWSGRLFGVREVTVRPCRAPAPNRPATFEKAPARQAWNGVWLEGVWYEIQCAACWDSQTMTGCTCGPDGSSALILPGPVDEILKVTLGGRVLTPQIDYKLASDGILYRLGTQGWPDANNPVDSVLDPNTGAWEIEYSKGIPVPPGGQVAAATLACELAKAMTGDNSCQLPSRVQSITRQGVTMAILDEFGSLEDGRTGIWEIDSWLASVSMPRQSPPQVWSPDMPRGRGTMSDLGWGRKP